MPPRNDSVVPCVFVREMGIRINGVAGFDPGADSGGDFDEGSVSYRPVTMQKREQAMPVPFSGA